MGSRRDRRDRRDRRKRPVDAVLFLQSSTHYLADAQVHATICRYLPALGFEVHAACNPGSTSQPSRCLQEFSSLPSVTVRPTRFGPTLTERGRLATVKTAVLTAPVVLAGVIGLTRYVRKQGIDAVHCTEKLREVLVAYAVARLSGARLVIHLHVKVERWFSAPTRWVMHRADRLLAISRFVAASAVDSGYSSADVSVALNSLTSPWDEFVRQAGDRADLLSEFDVPNDASIICIAARINQWKGQRELLQAMALIAPTVPNFVVLVVGRDETADESGVGMIDELRQFAESAGIGDRVRFTGFRADAHRLIRASDVLAMPSHEEPFGLVYVEAMAASRPVVAIDNGGTPEVVLDGITGLLSPAGDVEVLAANLRALLTDADLGDRLGYAGHQRAVADFSPERLAADVAAVYRSL
jgi:glycosyltransferase involved in cell wall biosynthesis